MKPAVNEVPDSVVEEARSVVPIFSAARLLALRELDGRSQAELADAAGITPSALSQAERGLTTPTAATLARLAGELGVQPTAFADRLQPTTAMEPQFRHLRRTPKKTRRQAEQLAYATASVAEVLRRYVDFPSTFDMSIPVDPDASIDRVEGDVEHAAEATRNHLGVAPDAPIGDGLVGLLERGGVTIVRDPETGPDIDAYSAIINGISLIVLDGAEISVWDRDNFNLAHELGHLVMHRGVQHTPGTRTVEAQAHRFAGALLAPADAILPELPRDLDWSRYFDLKRRWGMSMAALVRRAKDLGVITDANVHASDEAAQRSRMAERRTRVGRSSTAAPDVPIAVMSMADLGVEDVAAAAQLPSTVVLRVVGRSKPSLLDS